MANPDLMNVRLESLYIALDRLLQIHCQYLEEPERENLVVALKLGSCRVPGVSAHRFRSATCHNLTASSSRTGTLQNHAVARSSSNPQPSTTTSTRWGDMQGSEYVIINALRCSMFSLILSSSVPKARSASVCDAPRTIRKGSTSPRL